MNSVLIIARFTLVELIKGKLLYLSGISGLIIFLLTFISAELTFGVPARVALNIGLSMMSLSSVVIAIYVGSALIFEEIESRTIYMIVTRPVLKWQLLAGKILGVILLFLINFIILSLVVLLLMSMYQAEFSMLFIHSVNFILIEALIVMLFSILISLFSSKFMAALVSVIVLFNGHFIIEIKNSKIMELYPFFKPVINLSEAVLPMFYKINLKEYVLANEFLPAKFIGLGYTYSLSYLILLFILNIFIFNQKNLD